VTTADALSAISGSERLTLTESGGRPRHNMKFVKMPSFNRGDGYPSDWFKTLKDLV